MLRTAAEVFRSVPKRIFTLKIRLLGSAAGKPGAAFAGKSQLFKPLAGPTRTFCTLPPAQSLR
jgi:hypothetical protein